MKYYSEETVKNMLKDTRVEILTRNKYGYLEDDCRIVRPKVEDYPSIEIPEPHGRIIDENDLHIKDTDGLLEAGTVWDAPTILEASK